MTDDELAAELANRTVHGVMHIGWVPDGTGAYRGQMAVYVKPNGLLGEAYLRRDQAVPPPDRLPGDPPGHRAKVGGGRRGGGSGARLEPPGAGPGSGCATAVAGGLGNPPEGAPCGAYCRQAANAFCIFCGFTPPGGRPLGGRPLGG